MMIYQTAFIVKFELKLYLSAHSVTTVKAHNQLFMSAQHLLLLIIGLHVSTDHSVIFRSLICYKFQGAVHTFGIPVVFTLNLTPFISVGGKPPWNLQHIKDLKMTEWSVETCSPIFKIGIMKTYLVSSTTIIYCLNRKNVLRHIKINTTCFGFSY